MNLPLAHLDASVIEEVSPNLWRQVFDKTGWPTTLVGKKSFTHDDVLQAFERDEPTDDLLQALEALHMLGTEAGREAIMSAANDRRANGEMLPTGVGDRELALHLFLAQYDDAVAAEVFARAQTQVQEGADHRRYNEFFGKEARIVNDFVDRSNVLKDQILDYCRENDLGDHVQLRAFMDDGAYIIQIIRSHRIQTPLAVLPGRTARATIAYRPVHGDILRYDAAVGRLRIAARAASMIEVYRRIAGQALFDDEHFFTGEAVCNLKILQEKGRAVLTNHNVSGVGRVWMTECLWERGDRDLLQIRSPDCFRNIEELRLPLTEGNLIQAKLKIEIVGKSTRPVTVNIRVPSRIEITQKIHEQLVEEFLTEVGIRNATGSSSTIDLWSLYPWRHPITIWRALLRSEIDELVQQGVFKRIQLTSVPSAEHLGAGNVIETHALADGEYYGVSRMPEIPPHSLSATDVEGLELQPEKLRLYLRSKLSLTDPTPSWDGGELLDLGNIDVGDFRLRLYYALRQPAGDIGPRMRAAAAGAHVVMLIPTFTSNDSGLASAVLGEPFPSRARVIREAIGAAGLSNKVPAFYTASDNVRLVVDSRLGQIWVDGIEISGLRPETHPFRLVEVLAKHSPNSMSSDELKNHLSGARGDGDTTTRQAKLKARKSISAAMAAAGRAFDEDPFPPGPTGFYRCALHAHVV